MEKSEDRLIEWIAERFGITGLPIGIGDDMAMVPTVGGGLLATSDMLMDGVDFETRLHTPEQVGRKALAVSLSDCAAMAVRPRWALVSVALPNAWTMEEAKRLYRGIEEIAREYQCTVVGGDTNSWDKPLVIDVTILAEEWKGIAPVRRNGMREGDLICVTGELGGSLAGKHMSFTPRVWEAKALAERLGQSLHALMDLSDGLSVDGARMAKASGRGMELDEYALFRCASQAAHRESGRDGRSVVEHVLNDGEDFELLAAVDRAGAIEGLSLRVIGRAAGEEGLWLVRESGARERVRPEGWRHFVG